MIKLRKEIYSKDAIEIAQMAYEEYATIKFFSGKDYWILIFSNCRYDPSMTIKEFENYLINAENS